MTKPPYRVPSMTEIAATSPTGLTAASSFSGCGGSSLGYRMAGFRVLYANEFIEAARDTYRANAADYTVLDDRDVRTVEPADVLDKIGLAAGELDLFDGSPPCSSFSSAGKRHAGWGESHAYSDTSQRTDDLFFEFARLVAGIAPRTFVAENVSGLVKGSAKGYFKEILAALRKCGPGYRVEARLLDAQWLGVPQARQRLIFVGVRSDLGRAPVFPSPLPYRYSVTDAIGDLAGDESLVAVGGNTGFGTETWTTPELPAKTIGASPQTGNGRCPPGAVQTAGKVRTHDPETGQKIALDGFAIGAEWDKLAEGETSDRYFSLSRSSSGRPLPTVTARGGCISAASVTHPTQRRKLTLPELRRVCGFPDDFTLTGTYAQRWERLGRAVPPVMMAAIATAIRDRVLLPVRRG